MKAKLTILLTVLAAGALVVGGCGSNGDNSSESEPATSAAAPPPATTDTTATTDTSATTDTTEQTDTGSSGGAAGGEDLKLSADPTGQLKFDKTTLDAKAGKVTITMDNPAPVPHAIAIEGNGVDMDGKTVTKGGTSTVSADLKPGTYTFYCPVPGHEQAGMKGTLTVK
jgi:uncharacterized cupredoxin-like copper-binding protein